LGAGGWRLLRTSWPDPGLNLAFEWALPRLVAEGACPNTLRLWINPPCVVIGRSGRSLAEVRLEVCERMGLPVLKRPTAGGAVYHDEGNLNWTVVARKDDLPESIRWPSELEALAANAILDLLAYLGLEGRFEPRKGVFVGPYKLSGLAMFLGRGAVMVHGTLLVSADLRALRSALACKFEVANLAELTSSGLGPWEIGELLVPLLAEAFGVRGGLPEDRPEPNEFTLAKSMRQLAHAWPEGK